MLITQSNNNITGGSSMRNYTSKTVYFGGFVEEYSIHVEVKREEFDRSERVVRDEGSAIGSSS
jgi:hypothetical protein